MEPNEGWNSEKPIFFPPLVAAGCFIELHCPLTGLKGTAAHVQPIRPRRSSKILAQPPCVTEDVTAYVAAKQ